MAFNLKKNRHLYPFSPKSFDRGNGVRMSYIDEGQVEPLVMVHGNPSWSFLYREVIKEFQSSFRTIAPDHIGCGLSDKPNDDKYSYKLKSRIDDLEALLEHLKVTENINLMVHDWGGAIGMGYAVRHPDRIKRLIITNTGAFHMPSDMTFPWPLHTFKHCPTGEFLNRYFNAFSSIASITCSAHGLPADVRKAFVAPYDSYESRVATTRFVQDIPLTPEDDSYSTLSEIDEGLEKLIERPMLILWGRRDFVFHRSFFREWLKRFPQASAHSFSGAGHYLLEDVFDKVKPLMRSFLTERSAKHSETPQLTSLKTT